MDIKKLSKEAVRKTTKLERIVTLSDDQLRQVVGGGGLEGGGDVDPETCAIHFYYPADSLS